VEADLTLLSNTEGILRGYEKIKRTVHRNTAQSRKGGGGEGLAVEKNRDRRKMLVRDPRYQPRLVSTGNQSEERPTEPKETLREDKATQPRHGNGTSRKFLNIC